MTPNADYTRLIQCLRAARGLQAGGFYNAAKLFRAAAFSQQVRAANEDNYAEGSPALHAAIDETIAALEAEGASADFVAALRAGQQGALDNRTITFEEVPDVHVCRYCGEIFVGTPPEDCPVCDSNRLTFQWMTPVYFFDALTPAAVMAALAEGPQRLAALCEGLTEAQLNQPPAPGEWSMRETMWHILVAEQLFAGRIERLLTEDHPSLEGFASWNVGSKDGMSAAQILTELRTLRGTVLAQLTSMDAADWWRTGTHGEWGEVSLLMQATYFARHERSHWGQIIEARRAALG